MSRAKIFAWVIAGLVSVGLLMAQAPSSPALTGKVTSQAEGTMEGVLIGAKKAGSTIATWVVSDAQGRTAFLAKDSSQANTRSLSAQWDMTCQRPPLT